MGLLRRQRKSFEERVQDVEAWHRREEESKIVRETEILEAIGESTDEVAGLTLVAIENLEESQRAEFVKNVFRQLVVQALYVSDSLDIKTARTLQWRSLHGFGDRTGLVAIPAQLDDFIIRDSLEKTLPNDEPNRDVA